MTAREQPHDGRRDADQQVNVFSSRGSYDVVLGSLYESLKRERALREENEQLKAQDSVDHALAAVLVKGATRQTPFKEVQRQTVLVGNAKVLVRAFAGRKKAAVVFNVENQDPHDSWKLMQVRLFKLSTGETRPFALRTGQDEIVPGTSGVIAIVADKDAFASKDGPFDLCLQLFRHDGLLQASVVLDRRLVRE